MSDGRGIITRAADKFGGTRFTLRLEKYMKFAGYTFAAAAAVTLAAFGVGGASAAPSSVQRDGGPCYVHEFGKDSADGQLYCSALTTSWTSKSLSRAPKVNLGDRCPQLGYRAYVYRTDGVATCRQANDGLRWQW